MSKITFTLFYHCLVSLVIFSLKCFLWKYFLLLLRNNFVGVHRRFWYPLIMLNIYHKVGRHIKSYRNVHYFPSDLSRTIFSIRSYQVHILTPVLQLCQISLFQYLLLVSYHHICEYYVLPLCGYQFMTRMVQSVDSYEITSHTVLWILLLHICLLLIYVLGVPVQD